MLRLISFILEKVYGPGKVHLRMVGTQIALQPIGATGIDMRWRTFRRRPIEGMSSHHCRQFFILQCTVEQDTLFAHLLQLLLVGQYPPLIERSRPTLCRIGIEVFLLIECQQHGRLSVSVDSHHYTLFPIDVANTIGVAARGQAEQTDT